MFEHDEPPEPTDEELDEHATQQAVMAEPTIRIDGLSAAAVEIIVRNVIESNYRLSEKASEAVDEEVRKVVRATIEQVSREKISELVASVLEEGFYETDRYGNTTSRRITAKSLILEQLSVRAADGYGKPAQTPAERIAREVLEARFTKEFGGELERAKSGFRAQVDELLKGKLVTSLKEALGLK